MIDFLEGIKRFTKSVKIFLRNSLAYNIPKNFQTKTTLITSLCTFYNLYLRYRHFRGSLVQITGIYSRETLRQFCRDDNL